MCFVCVYNFLLIYIMLEESQNIPQYVRYRDVALQRSKEYYQKNKEKINEYARNRYHNMTQEQKNKQVEYRKACFNRQTEEKQNKMRQRAREYSKNRYHNMIVAVK